MATDKYVQADIPQFDGHYDHWAMRIENLLRSKQYWHLVELGIPTVEDGAVQTEAQKETMETLRLTDLKVKNYLFQAIDRTIMETILDKGSSKSIWDSMKQKYQGSTRVKRAQLQALRREFEVLQMKEGETVDEYFARTLTTVNKMKKILRSMTSRFDYVVCSIEESNDLSKLTIDELQSSLLVHKQRMNSHNRGDEQALNVSYEGGRGRGRGGRSASRGRGRGRGRQGFNKAFVECYKCHNLGHFQYECPNWEKGVYYAELDEEMLLMAQMDLHNSKTGTMWFLDSGCSNHMTGDRQWFLHLDESFRQVVKLDNNTKMAVMGKGSIKLRVNGTSQVITKVFYCPELKNNLLSIGQLQERNLAILIQHGECKIYHHERGLIMQTQMSVNRMFILLAEIETQVDQAQVPVPTCFKITSEDQTDLWHRRFGHLNFKGLRTLSYKQMVTGMPPLNSSSTVCTVCMIGKQHRETIPTKGLWRATKKLQLIHADICGPITLESNSHKRYILTFIDDYSRKLWTYFLNLKVVEKETGNVICCFRTDRGGEFTSLEFNEYCSSNGIARQLTIVYTPQQNGVAEWKNRTIMNMVRCMLTEKLVPKEFWPEAVNWVVHLLNRCPTLPVKDKTPEEAWSGFKPSVAHFKVFGCIGHVHIPDNNKQKLDDKSLQCVFLGLSQESKAYRMYDPVSKKIIISRDMVFEEDKNCAGLEWGDEDGSQEHDAEHVHEEEEQVVDGATGSSSSSNEEAENNPSSPVQGRVRRAPTWMEDYVSGEGLSKEEENNFMMLNASSDLVSFEDAKNGIWELTTLPVGAKKIGVKWVFKTKLNENGEVDKYKARLVAKGYSQQFGIDYTKVFAPSAFLHGDLNEAVFIGQPQGYEVKGEEDKVYRLKKALYGLKQAPRAWYSKIESYFMKEGFERCPNEHTLFTKAKGGKLRIVSVYADDLIFIGNDEIMFEKFKNSMKQEFDMSDLGKMKYFLGVEVVQDSEGIFINQKKYANEVLERFGMENSNLVKNPIGGAGVDATAYKQMVGSFMYMTATRPDLAYVVSLISRFMERPTELHQQAVKRVLRYLKGTTELGIFYKRGGEEKLVAYSDSDYAGDVEDRKSTSGYVFLLSSGAVAWSSKKQPVVTLSTTKAEFIAVASCACQSVWMRRILEKLGHKQSKCTDVFCDNSSAIKLSKNPVMHGRSKHIDIRFHFLRDLTKDGVVKLEHCGSRDQLADIMTKPLSHEVFIRLRELLGVCLAPKVN
uniref:Retrovirus-related Pol polyprotein from transposon TNT 1-94 n=1 Tax=Nelumbo nucifera TaxID=4432 RepID=A0A822XKI1_NELNU|nr:TPA_asm: hypothetical protein HUJ06_020919 [Nelumbo nucifera]